jgi:signal transduction histidine kinase/ketosteroid isomerase-like protein
VTALGAFVERHLHAFNTRDFDAWSELFAEDIEISVDAASVRGVPAARAHAEGVVRAFPGVLAELERVVAETDDTIVVEYRLVNPAADRSVDSWRLDGLACEIFQVRDGRIIAFRSYYSPTATDRTDAVNVPSRSEAGRIAEEQAALRRVATLVGRGVSQGQLFAAVNEEMARLVGADSTAMLRFEPDDTVTLVAAWSAQEVCFPVGERHPTDAALRSIRERGGPVRSGPAELLASGPFVDAARARGIAASIGVPIVVDGCVWGASFAASASREPFPDVAEALIADFTELVATAIADAQARSELQLLATEQAALRRVAELVARGVAPDEVFEAVAIEASSLLGKDSTALLRYERDRGAAIVAVSGGPARVGMRVPTDGDGIAADVLRTGRTTRIDSYRGLHGPAVDLARDVGLRAGVGAPIVVTGRLWGLIVAVTSGEPSPAGTEDRLAQFGELVAAAIGNAESRAEITASRARVVAIADETRRRIRRDLHDGAQQRLACIVITLKLAREARHDPAGPPAKLVDEALQHAEGAIAALGELVHGIMPEALSRGGLLAGVHSLTGRMNLPVHVDVLAERLPGALETTAYLIVAEALTNALKHAQAGSAGVTAGLDGDVLRLEVRDDGIGGADPAHGTGLVGLVDRVAASGGTIAITSPPGDGTTVVVALPTDPNPASANRA